jgi:hypothetical protein
MLSGPAFRPNKGDMTGSGGLCPCHKTGCPDSGRLNLALFRHRRAIHRYHAVQVLPTSVAWRTSSIGNAGSTPTLAESTAPHLPVHPAGQVQRVAVLPAGPEKALGIDRSRLSVVLDAVRPGPCEPELAGAARSVRHSARTILTHVVRVWVYAGPARSLPRADFPGAAISLLNNARTVTGRTSTNRQSPMTIQVPMPNYCACRLQVWGFPL